MTFLLQTRRAIGETKLKILAIIHSHENDGTCPHGYEIWKALQEDFHTYLDSGALRNVYRHLADLHEQNLISMAVDKTEGELLPRHLYSLTEYGRELREKFQRFLEICTISQ